MILLVVWNRKEWHYIAVKILSPLFREIMSSHDNDFYFLNCLLSSATGNKREFHKKMENENFCNVAMLSQDNIRI